MGADRRCRYTSSSAIHPFSLVVLYRRHLAGDLSAFHTLQKRRRDASATKSLHSLANQMEYILPFVFVVNHAS
jgi:hypothetical protein